MGTINEPIHQYLTSESQKEYSFNVKQARIAAACIVVWSAAFLACFITSLDTVWGLLGSSFSILIGYFLPYTIYIATKYKTQDTDTNFWERNVIFCILGICIFTPMLDMCT